MFFEKNMLTAIIAELPRSDLSRHPYKACRMRSNISSTEPIPSIAL